MITFVLIGFVAVLAIALGLVAYSSNNRKRAGQREKVADVSGPPVERRSN